MRIGIIYKLQKINVEKDVRLFNSRKSKGMYPRKHLLQKRRVVDSCRLQHNHYEKYTPQST